MSYIGRTDKLSQRAYTKVDFLATSGQTIKTGMSYVAGFVEVHQNGFLLTDNKDYTATNGNSVTFVVPLVLDDEVTITSLKTFVTADHYSKAEADTALATKLPLAGGTMTGDTSHGDNVKAKFGASDDLQIYHDGSNSVIEDAATGGLHLKTNGANIAMFADTELMAVFNKDDGVILYNNNAVKLATTYTGVDVSGTVTADGLVVGNGTQQSRMYIDADEVSQLIDGNVRYDIWTGGNKTMRLDANGDISFYEDTGSSAKFFWDASAESLGIGTSSPSAALDIVNSSTPRIEFGYGGAGSADHRIAWDSAGLIISADQSALSSGSTYLALATDGSEAMRIDSAGNVGIGQSTIIDSASGRAALTLGGSTSSIVAFGNAGTRWGGIYASSADYSVFSDSLMRFEAGGSERMRIDSSGNVIVGGTTAQAGDAVTLLPDGEVTAAGFYFSNNIGAAMNDTGIRKATTSTMVFDTASTERMRIDSLGNVGIGTSSPQAALDINGQYILLGDGTYSAAMGRGNALISGQTASDFVIASTGSNDLVLATGSADRLHIDSSGNVGIGVVPEAWRANDFIGLQVGTGAAVYGRGSGDEDRAGLTSNAYYDNTNDRWQHIATKTATNYYQVSGQHLFQVAPSGSADAAISWTTAMTIDNTGTVLVGTDSLAAIDGNTPTANGIALRDSGSIMSTVTSGGNAMEFRTVSNGVAGSISCSGNTTSYNTSSDYRLKTNVTTITNATERFKLLKPCNFDWIAGGNVDGFLSHELAEVVPAASTGTKDAMRDEEYEVSAATGDVFTAGVAEVTTKSQVMETVETGYFNLAGETIVETKEQGVTTELIETVVQRQDVDGVSTEVEVQVTTQVPTMETVITTAAVAEVIHSADVEQPETLEEGQKFRETTAQVMATRSVPDMQGIDQSKLVPLLTATVQELIARIEALEA
jgi:hypothetical protein